MRAIIALAVAMGAPKGVAWQDAPSIPEEKLLETPHIIFRNSLSGNNDFEAVVTLPAGENAFYRGDRFEAGQVAYVRSGGITFVGRSDLDGTLTAGSLGLCGEFAKPIALQDPNHPGQILRIGQGIFQPIAGIRSKPRDHTAVEKASWEVTSGENSVTFRQSFETGYGISYQLEKTIQVDPSTRTISVSWRLENTGDKRIETRHYSHNWLMIDGRTRSPALRLHVPVPFVESINEFAGKSGFRIRPSMLVFLEDGISEPEAPAFLSAPNLAGKNDVLLEDMDRRVAVEIVNDWSPFDLAVYVDRRGYCPESFITLDLPSGGKRNWKTVYRFFGSSDARPEWVKDNQTVDQSRRSDR